MVPSEFGELGFTNVKHCLYGYKYLLVFVDTVLGYVEVSPIQMEIAQIVAKEFFIKFFYLFFI